MSARAARVGDLSEQIRGVSYAKEEASSAPRPGYVPILRAGNDVVIAASSGSLDVVGKAARASAHHDASLGAFCKVLRPGSRIDPAYFAHFLLTRAYRQRVSALAAGIDINNLRSEHLDDLLIPVPPLAEQRRIAQILEKANGLRVKRRAAFFQLDALIGSVFAEMFGPLRSAPVTIADVGEKSHAQGWPWVLLTDVARLATGHTPDRTRSDCWGGATPWITLTEIRGLDGKVAFDTREHVSEAGLRNSAAVKLPPGTVCSSRTASVGFVTIMGREMSTSQDFVNWVCGEALHPVYLMHALLQSRARLRSLSTVLRPPKSLQTKFASRVRLVKQLQEQQSASVVHLDALFDALQTNAFSEVIAGDVVVGNIKNLK